MESKFENYIPYGNEWVKEMMKLKKADIIEMFKNKCAENNSLIIKLERAQATKQPTENANCAIFDVSLSLANQKAIEYAKLKHSDEYNDLAFERDISETEIDFARGFIACSEYLKANEG